MVSDDNLFDGAEDHVSARRKWYGRPYTREYKDRQDRMERFLEAFAKTDRITFAADAADVSVGTVHDWKNRDPDFALRFEEARMRYRDDIAAIVNEGATKGFVKTRITKEGDIVEYREVSERMVDLEAKRVDKSYRDRADVQFEAGAIAPVVVVPAKVSFEEYEAQLEARRQKFKDEGKL
jgi:hypothetical protein